MRKLSQPIKSAGGKEIGVREFSIDLRSEQLTNKHPVFRSGISMILFIFVFAVDFVTLPFIDIVQFSNLNVFFFVFFFLAEFGRQLQKQCNDTDKSNYCCVPDISSFSSSNFINNILEVSFV